jgi:hypothetical protein
MSNEILLISDVHVGSFWGPIFPGTEYEDQRTGQTIFVEPSTTNLFAANHWERMCRNVNPDVIIFNGDLIDGVNHGNHGAVYTDDPYVQIQHFNQLAYMLPQDVPIYVTKGTGYHCGNEIPAERIIANDLDATYGDELIIEEYGVRIFANHFAPHGQNKAATLERKIKEFASVSHHYGDADILVFSHNHAFASVMTSKYLAVMTPAWQNKTPYAADKNLISIPDIGYVTLKVEDRCNITVDRSGITHFPNPCNKVGRDPLA